METSEAKTFRRRYLRPLLSAETTEPKIFYDEFGAKIFERICTTTNIIQLELKR